MLKHYYSPSLQWRNFSSENTFPGWEIRHGGSMGQLRVASVPEGRGYRGSDVLERKQVQVVGWLWKMSEEFWCLWRAWEQLWNRRGNQSVLQWIDKHCNSLKTDCFQYLVWSQHSPPVSARHLRSNLCWCQRNLPGFPSFSWVDVVSNNDQCNVWPKRHVLQTVRQYCNTKPTALLGQQLTFVCWKCRFPFSSSPSVLHGWPIQISWTELLWLFWISHTLEREQKLCHRLTTRIGDHRSLSVSLLVHFCHSLQLMHHIKLLVCDSIGMPRKGNKFIFPPSGRSKGSKYHS